MFFRRELLRSYKSFTSVDFQNLGTGISPRKGALGAVVVKHYTNSAWETFDLPNIHNFVADSEPAKVAQMPANSTFSILSSKYITRNLGDIQLLFRAFGTSNYALPVSEYRQLRDLVVFKPERVALHELMIGVSTEYQIRDDEHFNAVVDALYQNEIMSQLSATESEINNAHEVIENYVRAKVVDKTFLNALVQDKIDLTLKSQHFVASQRIADKVDEKTLVDVVKKSTVDILLKNYTTAKISGIVTAVLEQTLAKGKEKRLSGKNNSERERIIVGLSKNKNNKRMTYMVAGGPATGKSSLVARIMKSGVNLQDYCTIAPDRLLPLLTNRSVVGPNEKYHAELLSEECRVVVEGIQKRLLTMMKLNGEAPNVLIEMLVPYEDKVELGTYGEGRFKVFVTSYKPELAVEGGYQRFLNQGRFVPKEYVLEGQKRLSVYLPSMVDKYKNSGKKYSSKFMTPIP